MALTRLNYQPGQYEACTDETLLPSSPVLNTWYNFEIGNWKHAISDIVLKQGGSPIPETAYELAIDTKYTGAEANNSGKTVYGKWRIIDGDYDEIATTVSGNNFGAYVDNEKLDTRLPYVLRSTVQSLAGVINYDFPIPYVDVIFYSAVVIVTTGKYVVIPQYHGDVVFASTAFMDLVDNAGKARIAIDWSSCDGGLDDNINTDNTVIITLWRG